VAFDNQSADAKAGQLGERVARIASLQLVGAPDVFTYVVSNGAEAPLRRATQIVSGYLTLHSGQWTLHAQLRDAMTPRTLRSFTVAGSSAGALADGVAGQLGKPGFAAGKLDPAALESALTGGVPVAILGEAAVNRLLPLPAEFPLRLAALQRLSSLAPCDSEVAYGAATLSMQARQFGKAAEAYRRAQRADPEWTLLHNEAAFGYVFAGDVPAALAAVESYRKLDPRSPNPDDSQGEILFAARRFDEAERAFLLASSKDPAFLNGAPLRKAAEARRMAGNQAEADRLFARYAEARAKQSSIGLEKAQWDYTSGRTKEGLAALEAMAASTGAAVSPVWSQLAVWRAVHGGDGVGAAKQALQTARSPGDRQAAATVFFATQPDVPVAEWQARAAKQFPPAASPLSRQALLYALALHKHWNEAIPILAAQRDALQPVQASQWQALLAVALSEAGQAEKAKAESKFAPIPRTAGDATWEFLIHPKIKQLVTGAG
jgi:tetratricopeptide (TPR) repeat protein